MSKSKGDKIKELEKELSALERKILDCDQVVSDMLTQKKKDVSRAAAIKNQISNLKPKELTVSEHALLRYIERKYNMSLAELKKEILSQVQGLGEFGTVKAHGFVIKGNVVATYAPADFDYEKARNEEKCNLATL